MMLLRIHVVFLIIGAAIDPTSSRLAELEFLSEPDLALSKHEKSVVQSSVQLQLTKESRAQSLSFSKMDSLVASDPGSTLNQFRTFTGASPESLERGRKLRTKLLALEKQPMISGRRPTNALASREVCRPSIACNGNSPYRNADGSCNNLAQPSWGKASIAMRRWLKPHYADGLSKPRSSPTLPNPRLISRTVHTASGSRDLNNKHTHMLMQWGQFLNHDLNKTPAQQARSGYGSSGTCCGQNLSFRPECFPITIPAGDAHFKHTCMEFFRSVQVENADCNIVPVEQLNEATAYLDASQVYGSSVTEQRSLRSLRGGKMKQKGTFLPKGSPSSCRTGTGTGSGGRENYCFKAGDFRVNQQPGLQTLHTIFVREHNRIAETLARRSGNSWSDEKLFQESRKIVGAIMQKITFGEYLPIVLGSTVMSKYDLKLGRGSAYTSKYSQSQDASIRNAFASAALRMGHSMIYAFLNSVNTAYSRVVNDRLSDLFGDTSRILSDRIRTLGHYTRGLVHDSVQTVDRKMTSEVTNHLFKGSRGPSFDLASLNIQRGRDHGLPGYVHWRSFCSGGSQPHSFSQLSSTHDASALSSLKKVYKNVVDIDLFTGGLTETPTAGSLLGPTFACLLGKQFQALRRGDRFWFEENSSKVSFTPAQLNELRKASLSRVICDNTDTFKIQRNAFVKDNKKVSCASLPSIDLTKWITNTWGPWGPWRACTGGRQTRTRTCVSGSCTGPRVSSRRCSSYRCPTWCRDSRYMLRRRRYVEPDSRYMLRRRGYVEPFEDCSIRCRLTPIYSGPAEPVPVLRDTRLIRDKPFLQEMLRK